MVEIYDKKSRFYSIKLTIMAIVPLWRDYVFLFALYVVCPVIPVTRGAPVAGS